MCMTTGSFLWKIWKKKMTWVLSVFERVNVFFDEMQVLKQTMGRENLFFRTTSEKMGLLWIFMPCNFDRIEVFWTICGQDCRGFSCEIFKKKLKNSFWENGFFDKIWAWDQVFLEKRRFFTTYGHEGNGFFREICYKKMQFLVFLAQ